MDGDSARLDLLIKCLDQHDKKALREGVEALISMASGAPEVADRLCAVLDTAPAEKRWPIAYVLAQIAPLSTACLDALEDALDQNDPDIRWAVALLLVGLGKKSDSGVAAHLIDLLSSGKPTQRRMAVYCLRDIGAEDLLRPAVQRALDDFDPLVRVAAVTSLKNFPALGREVTERLLRLVSEESDSRVLTSAAFALAHLGAPDEKILRTLDDASRSSNAKLAKAARAALALLKQKGSGHSTE